MTSARERWYRGLFLTATIYDLVLGTVFLFFGGWAFDLLGIRDEMPEGGYVPLIGAFLLVIGVAYWLIYRGDLERNKDLIAIGALYKLAYSGVGFSVGLFGDVPHVVFVALFGVVDTIFFVLMAECWLSVRKLPKARAEMRRMAAHI